MKTFFVCLCLLFVAAVNVAAQQFGQNSVCYNQDEVDKAIEACENATRDNGNNWPFGGRWPFGNRWPFGPEGRPDFGNRWPFGNEGRPDFGNRWPFGNEGRPDFGNRWPFGNEGRPDFGNRWPFGNEGRPDFGNRWPFGNEGRPDFGNRWPFGNEGRPDFGNSQSGGGDEERQDHGGRRPGGGRRPPGGGHPGGIWIGTQPGGFGFGFGFGRALCRMQAYNGIQNNSAALDFASVKENLAKVAKSDKLNDLNAAVDTCSRNYTSQDGENRSIRQKNMGYAFCFMRQTSQICASPRPDGGVTDSTGGNTNGGNIVTENSAGGNLATEDGGPDVVTDDPGNEVP